MKKILNVKQAAKILGVSTNTMHKYLNQGTVTAARGQGQGSFHIPVRSLELFLGSALSEETLAALEKENTLPEPGSPRIEAEAPHVVVEPAETTTSLTTKVIRTLLIIGLVLVIADIATTTQFSFINQLTRIGAFAVLLLLSYQQGGFVKK